MKTTHGYGIQYGNETLKQAISYYLNGDSVIHETKKEALKTAKENSEPDEMYKVFKITVEAVYE